MIIEIARADDVPDLVHLLSILFSQEKEFTPDSPAQVKGLTAIIDNPQIGEIIVARENEKIIGMVSILYTISTALGGKVCLLEDMIVLPEMRGLNTGSTILEFAISHAHKAGCLRITLLTDSSNVSARNFYKRFGFQESSMIPLRFIWEKKSNNCQKYRP